MMSRSALPGTLKRASVRPRQVIARTNLYLVISSLKSNTRICIPYRKARMEVEPVHVPGGRRRKWSMFFIGLTVCLAGLGLLWLGDGHDSLFRKSLIVLGLLMSIGGIAALRYLLLAPFISRSGSKK